MKKNSLFFLGVCLAAAALLIFSSCSAQENGAETGGMTEKETDAVGMTEKETDAVEKNETTAPMTEETEFTGPLTADDGIPQVVADYVDYINRKEYEKLPGLFSEIDDQRESYAEFVSSEENRRTGEGFFGIEEYKIIAAYRDDDDFYFDDVTHSDAITEEIRKRIDRGEYWNCLVEQSRKKKTVQGSSRIEKIQTFEVIYWKDGSVTICHILGYKYDTLYEKQKAIKDFMTEYRKRKEEEK